MLEIDHLTKRFGEKAAVDDLTLRIAPPGVAPSRRCGKGTCVW